MVLGSAGAGRGQATGRTGIGSACYATEQDRRRRGWRRQHLAQPRSRTGRALRTAAHLPGHRPQHPSHRGPKARRSHAATTRTGIRGEPLGGQTDPGSGDKTPAVRRHGIEFRWMNVEAGSQRPLGPTAHESVDLGRSKQRSTDRRVLEVITPTSLSAQDIDIDTHIPRFPPLDFL